MILAHIFISTIKKEARHSTLHWTPGKATAARLELERLLQHESDVPPLLVLRDEGGEEPIPLVGMRAGGTRAAGSEAAHVDDGDRLRRCDPSLDLERLLDHDRRRDQVVGGDSELGQRNRRRPVLGCTASGCDDEQGAQNERHDLLHDESFSGLISGHVFQPKLRFQYSTKSGFCQVPHTSPNLALIRANKRIV